MPSTTTTHPIAFITGANQGIGLAVAQQLAKSHGFHVIIGSRKLAAGQEAAAAIKIDGGQASAVQLDVTSDESLEKAVKWIEAEFGRLDVLVNNAGVLLDFNKSLSTRELFQQTLSTNTIGVACLTEACVPLLVKSSLPRIIFVSSSMGSLHNATDKTTFYYSTDYKAYDCSKAALGMLALNYVRIMDEATGGKALVNVVCPGLVKSQLTGYHDMGTSTELGAKRIVELAVAEAGSASGTFSDRNGSIPW